jgi:hypothetical protein
LVDSEVEEVLPIRLQQLLTASARRESTALHGLIPVRQEREKEVLEQILASMGE